MTTSRPRPFDVALLRKLVSPALLARARDCLQLGPVQGMAWRWELSTLVLAGVVRDPSGHRYASEVHWDGEALEGDCSCDLPDDPVCPHQLALALSALRLNPWRQDPPVGWQVVLGMALPPSLEADGESRFIFRVELRARPGDPIGHVRLRLSRARYGRRKLGQETPYPASRLKGLSLDTLPMEERALLSWLMPLQGWLSLRSYGFTSDPRYLEIPPPLVDATLRALARFPLAFMGDDGESPVRVSPYPLIFGLQAEAHKNGAIRLFGRLQESIPAPEGGAPREVFPDLILGESPCYALVDGIFYRIERLERPELWSLSRTADFIVPYKDMGTFLENFVSPLKSQELLTSEMLQAAMPEVITEVPPHPMLTLEEDSGRLVAFLSFRYGPGLMVSATTPRAVEELELGDRRLLLHRNLSMEEQLEQQLQGLTLTTPGRFEGAGEGAVRFLVEQVPVLLAAGWSVEGEDRLARYRPARTPIRIRGVVLTGLNWFDVQLEAVHGQERMPISELFHAWRAGRRFVRFGNGELAMLPEEWLERNRSLLSALLGERPVQNVPEREDDPTLTWQPHGSVDETLQAPLHLAPLLEGLWEGEVSIEANQAWRGFIEKLKTFGGIVPAPMPQGLHADLRVYQKQGLDWLCFLRDYKLAGVLADDMGLGKTLQTLALLILEAEQAQLRGEQRPVSLVVTPTSVLFNWEAEARRFTPTLRVKVLHGPARHAHFDVLRDCDLLITSYALLRRDLNMHLEMPYHYVILDEAQWIKNPESLTAAAARALKANHRLTLTGTPIENRLNELWSQFAFLMPGMLPDLRTFMQQYVFPIERDQDKSCLEELRRRVHPFILRRLKEQVASELPPRTDNVLYCELENAQRQLYEAVLKASREKLQRTLEEKGAGQARMTALDALLKLRQICCHPRLAKLPEALGVEVSCKLELFSDMIQEVLSEGHRVLVFSQFVEMLSVLRTELERLQITYEYLDGRTRDRQERVDRFNAGSAPVFLISLKAGGTGLNLASADYVVHYDPWWNPAVEDQATDRAYRIGQTRPVFSYKLIARNTVEEKILVLQQRKRELARGLLDAGGEFEPELSLQDLEFLLADDDTWQAWETP